MQNKFYSKPASAVLFMAIMAVLSVPKSLTGDEALTVNLAAAPWEVMLENLSSDIHLPGYYALLQGWMKLFGKDLDVLRLFAFLPVAVLIFAGAGRLGRYSFLLLGTSPFLLHLAVELRMYGLLAMLGTLILINLDRFMKTGTVRNFIFLTLLCAASVWVHYFAWAAVLGVFICLFIRGRWKNGIILVSLCIAAILPWLPRLLVQVGNFAPSAAGSSEGLMQTATLSQRIAGVPFSMAGTLLRFSSGNSDFSFNLFSIRSLSVFSVAGIILFALSMISAWYGRKKTLSGTWIIFLAVFVPLSFLRPSSRHFAMSWAPFAALVAAGIGERDKPAGILRVLIPLLSLLLCSSFISRSTMPQRCTFDRDFREAAITAGSLADQRQLPVVLYLDSYSAMGVLYHLYDQGFNDITVNHPYEERFVSGTYFSTDPEVSLSFLMQDTDSLVSTWDERLLLLANDPTLSRGPLYGDSNMIIGRGSDLVADIDLVTALENRYTIERIPLPGSRGPFSLFLLEEH